MPDWLESWIDSLEVLSWWEALLYGVIAAYLAQLILTRVVLYFTRHTKTALDDHAISSIRSPLFWTVLFIAAYVALRSLRPDVPAAVPGEDAAQATAREAAEASLATYVRWQGIAVSVMLSIGVILWMRALMRIGDAVLDVLARRVDEFTWIEPRSLPLYEIATKLLLVGSATYGLMLAWDIDLTAWLASAGILGIAIGFAAKDTLANLFAGIFILADAPYKLGDFIVLESGERGRVTDIGIRSTRILTRDDIEVTMPNGVMANSKIINESSGPHVKRRLRVNVGVAYGCDLAKAREAMLAATQRCDLLAKHPAPSVRFRSFGDSALIFQVRGYIDRPVMHGRAVDQVCTQLYEALSEAQVEIPFPQRVVHMST